MADTSDKRRNAPPDGAPAPRDPDSLPTYGGPADAPLPAAVKPVPGAPAPAMRALERGLAKDPKARFESCPAFVAALAGERPVSQAAGRGRRARGLGVVLLVLLGAVGIGVGPHWRANLVARREQAEVERRADAARRQQDAAEEARLAGIAAAKREKLPALLTDARAQQGAKQYAAAAESVRQALEIDPANGEADRLCVEISRAVGLEQASPAKGRAEIEELHMRVPPGFRAAAGAVAELYTNTGWAKEVVHEATGIEMVYVPAGQFEMGSNNGFGAEKPVHTVRISQGFYLGKFEVTQGQWQAAMGSNPSGLAGAGRSAPVEQVSWDDCQGFCGRLGSGFRLPTEAEWEFACRAGTTGDYAGDLDGMGWYSSNSANTTHPVGQKQANGWGLYDMHGNVWEWCQDWYGEYPSGAVTDPAGPGSGSGRVLRGGSWRLDASCCRSARRSRCVPGRRFNFLGLRLLMTVPGS